MPSLARFCRVAPPVLAMLCTVGFLVLLLGLYYQRKDDNQPYDRNDLIQTLRDAQEFCFDYQVCLSANTNFTCANPNINCTSFSYLMQQLVEQPDTALSSLCQVACQTADPSCCLVAEQTLCTRNCTARWSRYMDVEQNQRTFNWHIRALVCQIIGSVMMATSLFGCCIYCRYLENHEVTSRDDRDRSFPDRSPQRSQADDYTQV